jgi:hypothetical protein
MYINLNTGGSGGDSAVVTVTIDGQTTHGGSAGVIKYYGGTSQISEICRPEKSGECFDCCQGFEFATSASSESVFHTFDTLLAASCMTAIPFSDDDSATGMKQS